MFLLEVREGSEDGEVDGDLMGAVVGRSISGSGNDADIREPGGVGHGRSDGEESRRTGARVAQSREARALGRQLAPELANLFYI